MGESRRLRTSLDGGAEERTLARLVYRLNDNRVLASIGTALRAPMRQTWHSDIPAATFPGTRDPPEGVSRKAVPHRSIGLGSSTRPMIAKGHLKHKVPAIPTSNPQHLSTSTHRRETTAKGHMQVLVDLTGTALSKQLVKLLNQSRIAHLHRT